MQFRHSPKREVSLNLTPLIDVVFLLLIFFMVSTSFTRETQIKLELPEANGSELVTEKEVLEISIDNTGKIFINGRGLRNNELATVIKAIEKTIKGNTNISPIISADKNAPYQAVVTAMDAAGQVGLNNLQMATVTPKEE